MLLRLIFVAVLCSSACACAQASLSPGANTATLNVPSKELHKMSVAQLDKEMPAVGLAPIRTIETLPQQHILIFGKR